MRKKHKKYPAIAALVIAAALIVSACGGSGSGDSGSVEVPAASEPRSPVGTWRAETGSYTHFYADGTGRTESGAGVWEFTWEVARMADKVGDARLFFYTVMGGLVDLGVFETDEIEEFFIALHEYSARYTRGEIATFEELNEYAFAWFDDTPVRVLFLNFQDDRYSEIPLQEFVYVLDGDSMQIITGPFGGIFSMEVNVDLRLSGVTLTAVNS